MKRTSDAIRDASTRRAWLAGAAGVAGAAWLPGAVMAQTPAFPARALKLIVPFPPGGPTDIVARPLALMLSAVLQQQVVVEVGHKNLFKIWQELWCGSCVLVFSLLLSPVLQHMCAA